MHTTVSIPVGQPPADHGPRVILRVDPAAVVVPGGRSRASDLRLKAVRNPPLIAVAAAISGGPQLTAPGSESSSPLSATYLDASAPGASRSVYRLLSGALAGVQGAEPPASLDTLTQNSVKPEIYRRILDIYGFGVTSRRMKKCGSIWRAMRIPHKHGCSDDHGEVHLQSCQCGLPGCPSCQATLARAREKVLSAKIAVALDGQTRQGLVVKHLVLTLRSGVSVEDVTPDSLEHHRARGFAAIREMLKESFVRRCRNWGAYVKVEVGALGNVHFHILLVGVRWIDQAWLSRRWHELTGDSDVVWVSGARRRTKRGSTRPAGVMVGLSGAVSELAKYVSKPNAASSWWLPALVAVAWYGKRKTESFGSLRGVDAIARHWVRHFQRSCRECGAVYRRGRWACTPELALASLSVEESAQPRGPPAGRLTVRPHGWDGREVPDATGRAQVRPVGIAPSWVARELRKARDSARAIKDRNVSALYSPAQN